MPQSEEKRKMLSGELYHSFAPDLIRDRARCLHACHRYNNAYEIPRRRRVELWRDISGDTRPMPPLLPPDADDDAQFEDDPWIEPPVRVDYGTNVRFGTNVYINFNCIILDVCLVSIGSRALIGPNVSFYTASHPMDPELRNGTNGPEIGKEIHVEDDCFIGGNVIILPGVRVGRGSTIGAGSVVTRDVPPFHVVAGNPARIIRKAKTNMDPTQDLSHEMSEQACNPIEPERSLDES
ncbi:hypothetical protein MMC12_007287 [Toensbergia leucococca]|nr:hypothetical protein [Toensbergia leucococca]